MFDLSPAKLLVLLIIGILVVGPDRLPTLVKDATRLLRSLRDMATGAREQLRTELGPEFANADLRSLHPRTVVQQALFGDDPDNANLDLRTAFRDALVTEGDTIATEPPPAGLPNGSHSQSPSAARTTPPAPRPRPKPGPRQRNR